MGSKIEDLSVMRLNYHTDNKTCTPGWKVFNQYPNCIISSYPKEWLASEIEADAILGDDLGDVKSFEPYWKLIIGNKAILPLLWNKYPNHKYLLPAYFQDPREEIGSDYVNAFAGRHWVSKPMFGREGLGVFYSQNYTNSSTFDNFVRTTEDNFGKDFRTNEKLGKSVYQMFADLPVV